MKKAVSVPNAEELSAPPGKRSSRDYLPARKTLPSLRAAAENCRGCDLYKNATQVVFGEGAAGAECMLIGEQPGDQEDQQGKPFVGPAGKILDKALDDAGIQKERVYTTNAVKHFKHEVRGKRRLHRAPNRSEVKACRPWLEQELKVTKPKVIVCLGVSAANSLLEQKITLKDVRGQFFQSPYSDRTFVTTHPSSILRSITSEDRHQKYDELVADLRLVAKELKK
jgi:uracil-DNA glycosylase